jgi:hypothetical protein
MVAAQKTRKPTAPWNEEETKALLDYLLGHKSEIDNGGMFKMGTYNAIASEIVQHHILGPERSQLKAIYSSIQKFQEMTLDLHWDNSNGANVEKDSEISVCNMYVVAKVYYCHILYYQKYQCISPHFQGNAPIWPFCNKGWEYLMTMKSIIPVLGAKGHFAFAAGTTSSTQIIKDKLNCNTEDLPDAIKAAGSSRAGAVGNVGDVDGDGK